MNTSTRSASAQLFSPAGHADPYSLYEQMRANEPVCAIRTPDGRSFWLVTRYEDAAEALVDPRLAKDLQHQRVPGQFNEGGRVGRNMLVTDPPDHTRLRGLVRQAFNHRLVEGLRPRVQQIADDLLDKVVGLGRMDVMSDYAFPLPITVIAELLGVPSADRDRLRAWSDTAMSSGFVSAEEIDEATRGITGYMSALVAVKRADPGDDLITGLLHAEESGDRLTESELLAMVWLLLVAGHETTVNLIGNGMLALLRHPDQLARLRDDPALIGTAVEELLRYDSPLKSATWRFALEGLELAGQPIAKGDTVLVVLGSANRDETRFARADRLDITRDDNKHLAFGRGIHFCLGAPLARLEGEIAIATLLRRLPRLRLAVPAEELTWRSSFILRGLQALPVEFA